MSLTLDLLDEGKSRANTISAKLEDQECAAGWVDCGLCQVKRIEKGYAFTNKMHLIL